MHATPRAARARSAPDALAVFAVAFAQNLALQVAKDVREYGPRRSAHLLLTAPLAIAVIACHRNPAD